jgi:hypothetical protein
MDQTKYLDLVYTGANSARSGSGPLPQILLVIAPQGRRYIISMPFHIILPLAPETHAEAEDLEAS